MKIFCVEILGESAFHKVLVQSGWSGKDYVFQYNEATQSHVRAYPAFEDYLAERVDMHKASNVWPLLGNLVDAALLTPEVMVGKKEELPRKRGGSAGKGER